jgi:hypothetical protein
MLYNYDSTSGSSSEAELRGGVSRIYHEAYIVILEC